jgi:hypothetical protein
MKSAAIVALGLVLSVTCVRYASGQESKIPSIGTGAPTVSGDELHFVSVLSLKGEVTTMDPANRAVTVKRPDGNVSTLEVRSAADLAGLKPGDQVTVRYFEGAQLATPEGQEGAPLSSLSGGLIGAELGGSSMKQPLVGTVDRVDAINQELTLKGTDGSLETIMIINPEALENVKAGEKVVLANPQALALTLAKEG